MTTATLANPTVAGRVDIGLVDCDIHPTVRSMKDLYPYMPKRWHEHIDSFGQRFRQAFVGSTAFPKATPALSRRDAWPEDGGAPGSSLALMQRQHLDANGIDRGMLYPLFPRGTDERNVECGQAICRAINDWQIEQWLELEPRLRGTITVMAEDPDGAVAEIERCARIKGFVQVAMTTRAIEPLGRRRYWRIFEAAAHHGFPLGLHNTGNNGHAVTGGGAPSFYFEEHQAVSLSMHSMVSSFILEGVTEHLPDLKIVVVEGGFAWVAPLGWRMDGLFERFRGEVPHLKRRPSEYLRRNFWFTTQPMEEPEKPEHLREMVNWMGWDRLLFASDYPHWDSDDPRYAFKIKLSEDEKKMIFACNAKAVYGDRL
jgi:predicted TIM-barrel fold metal-dependent hydrolase